MVSFLSHRRQSIIENKLHEEEKEIYYKERAEQFNSVRLKVTANTKEKTNLMKSPDLTVLVKHSEIKGNRAAQISIAYKSFIP